MVLISPPPSISPLPLLPIASGKACWPYQQPRQMVGTVDAWADGAHFLLFIRFISLFSTPRREGVLAVPAATADPDEVLVVAVDAGSAEGDSCAHSYPFHSPSPNHHREGVLAVPAATADPDEVLVVAGYAGALRRYAGALRRLKMRCWWWQGTQEQILLSSFFTYPSSLSVCQARCAGRPSSHGTPGRGAAGGAHSPPLLISPLPPFIITFREGVLAVPAATADPDEVLVVAVDAGADDVINPGEDMAGGGGGGGHGEEGEEEEQ
ncbi:unnamed protein product [Closterium sp. NIES-53]